MATIINVMQTGNFKTRVTHPDGTQTIIEPGYSDSFLVDTVDPSTFIFDELEVDDTPVSDE